MNPTRLALLMALVTLPAWAAEPPTVVELFTSKYCPSCPAAESYLRKEAAGDTNLLVVMENVDYWDHPPAQVDPYGKTEFTERQYDYSNLLSDRPGKVFTPQPIINGAVVANPPLFFGWGSALEQGRAVHPAALSLSQAPGGGLIISLPEGVKMGPTHELTLIGMDKEEGTALWRAKGITPISKRGDTIPVAAAQVPPGSHVLALVQLAGPGKVVASGVIKVK